LNPNDGCVCALSYCEEWFSTIHSCL